MQLFFEGSTYRTEVLRTMLGKSVYDVVSQNGPGRLLQTLDCVGYCFNADRFEHVFILPKVFRSGNKAFGVIDIQEEKAIDLNDLSDAVRKELQSLGWDSATVADLPLYLYLAIEKFRLYNEEKTKTTSVIENTEVVSSKCFEGDRTLLDTVLSLRDFYRENPNLFVLVYKQCHSGYNKVNWTKTIRTKIPMLLNGDIIYPVIVNQKKKINYDEELLVIFFNTLRYINNEYGFCCITDQPYNLMSDGDFKRKFETGVIKKRLEAIREVYYNERMVKLWDLLHVFAEKTQCIKNKLAGNEYLLVRKFNNVFESMIDCILGDTNLPKKLWKQSDGKIVDHLFIGDSILENGKSIYYIGDSKYYKDEDHPVNGSLFKQYTYAKNIIQQEIDWYHKGDTAIIYRDDLTEGYNITPNFFISGVVENGWGYFDDHLQEQDYLFKINWQFSNRVFDRDTLFLRQYDINFLFVLFAYVSKDQSVRSSFKEKAKRLFKQKFVDFINNHYDFYILKAKSATTEEQITNLIRDKYFWLLHGKVICPYNKTDPFYGLFVLGLEIPAEKEQSLVNLEGVRLAEHNSIVSKQNIELLLRLEDDFIIKSYSLGTDPYVYYEGCLNGVETSRTLELLNDVEDNLSKYKTECVLFGCYQSKEQLDWILRTQQYCIPFTEHWNGTASGHNQSFFTACYLFLYDINNISSPAICFVLSTQHAIKTGKQLLTEGYAPSRNAEPDDRFFIYKLSDKIRGTMTVDDIISKYRKDSKGCPLFLHFAETKSIPHEWIPNDN